MTTTEDATGFNPKVGTDLYLPPENLHIVPQLQTYFRPAVGNLPDPLHLTLGGLGPRAAKKSGWFSPSTHPTWPLRDLVMYAIDPESIPDKEFPEESQVSMLMGSIFHEIFNFAVTDMGIAIEPEGKTCELCKRPRGRKIGRDSCNEHAVFDRELKRRGHIDAILSLPGLGTVPVDFKTCSSHAMKWIDNHDATPYINGTSELRAKYYGQGQEYLALTGYQKFVLIFFELGTPWRIKEVVLDRDQPYIDALQDKYRTAREMAARREIPPA